MSNPVVAALDWRFVRVITATLLCCVALSAFAEPADDLGYDTHIAARFVDEGASAARQSGVGCDVSQEASPIATQASTRTAAPPTLERLTASLSALPLSFERNQGQTNKSIQYLARAAG